jgi:hypothetical protein
LLERLHIALHLFPQILSQLDALPEIDSAMPGMNVVALLADVITSLLDDLELAS